jgi:hypothetical protein
MSDRPAQEPLSVYELPADCDPRLRQLYEYWLAARPPDCKLPGRQHVDPTKIPILLPWIWLVDVQRKPLRFKHRLTGTEQVRLMGREVTGQWMDEAHPHFVSSPAYQQFVAVAERGVIAYRRGRPMFHLGKEFVWLERLLLPLAQDGEHVDMLLAITIYFRQMGGE